MNELDFYRQQSVFTEPGAYAAIWDSVNPTIEDMKAAITPLLFHYRGDGDFAENGIAAERIEDINLRYAGDMLAHVNSLQPIVTGQPRAAKDRMVGCCRDWALLFVSLARHHGFPARSRVGFSGYFADGWWIDHTIAEIWDDSEQRWRLVDAQLREPWTLASGQQVNPEDISREIFLPGLDAWHRTRAGEFDSATFVVAPDLMIPDLRDWPYLRHNVVQDIASLNRYEMLLWDVWGIDNIEGRDPTAEELATLDEAAAATTFDQWRQIFAQEEYAVPETVQSFHPDKPGHMDLIQIPRN
ncbi:MAG: transglutaminase-like domain-containing protein [Thermomicrobiales bacterium]|nr:transglutaminase-like domain-containing protein [Thermomicrobiales bacterium]MCO5218697.1 transglutaminase-like domain-containing protein [Thermomicrobiales bacterium]MCO5225725.1 transglutaminase-like domain-containing protein [Thermomicrobiales bacterium]MCO5228038.1 transglutaminase-like domain-containing protein [Thermomicrobiales bacterium]